MLDVAWLHHCRKKRLDQVLGKAKTIKVPPSCVY